MTTVSFVTHVIYGRDGEVVDEVPLVARDALLAAVVRIADLDIGDEVATRAVIIDVRHRGVELVHEHARLVLAL